MAPDEYTALRRCHFFSWGEICSIRSILSISCSCDFFLRRAAKTLPRKRFGCCQCWRLQHLHLPAAWRKGNVFTLFVRPYQGYTLVSGSKSFPSLWSHVLPRVYPTPGEGVHQARGAPWQDWCSLWPGLEYLTTRTRVPPGQDWATPWAGLG